MNQFLEPPREPRLGTGLGRRLVANTLHAASGRLAALVLWLIFTPAILTRLGAAGFAVWAFFFALTGYLANIDLGLAQATLRHAGAARGRGTHDEAGAFATLGVAGYLALGAVWLLLMAPLHGLVLTWLRIPADLLPTARFAMFAGAAVFALTGIAAVTMAVAQGYGRFDLANRVLLAVTGAQAIGFALVLRQGWGLEALVVTVGLGWLLGCVLGVTMLRAGVPEFHWSPARSSLTHLGSLVRFGGPMQVTNLLAVFNLHLDKILLSRFVALSIVTPYELGSRVATAVSTIPQLILVAVLPEAAALHAAGNRDRLRDLYERGSRFALGASALALAPLFGCADRLYGVWLGPNHGDAAMVLRALAVAVGFSLATGMGTTVARSIARTDLEAWFAVCAVSTHLGLSLWLVPRMGLRGALVASQVAHGVGAVLFMVLLGRTLSWPLWRVVARPCGIPFAALVVGSGVGTLLDRILPASRGAGGWVGLLLASAGASGATLVVLFATRYFRWREVRSLLLGTRSGG